MPLKNIIEKKRDDVDFLIFMPFLIGFLVSRAWRLYPGNLGPSLNFGEGELYTGHHLYYGITLLIIAAWIAINYKNERTIKISAIFYGAGLGIFFDQIGYLITQFQDYHTSLTYYVIVSTGLILVNIIAFENFWKSVGSEMKSFAEENKLEKGPLKLAGMFSFLNKMEEKYPKRKKLTSYFMGTALISAGILLLIYPTFLEFYISAAFILTGLANLISLTK